MSARKSVSSAPKEPALWLLDVMSCRLIPSFDVWIARLRKYNTKYWNNYFSEEEFAAAEAQLTNIPAAHRQAVFGVYGFHVQFDSLLHTFQMWCKVLVGELGDDHVWHSTWVTCLEDGMQLHEQARSYDRGIHLVQLNLVAHRCNARNQNTNDLDCVYRHAGHTGETIAQLETLSFYGVLLELLKMQGHGGLPYPILAGAWLFPGFKETERDALYIRWDAQKRQVVIGWWSEYQTMELSQAVPVVL